MAESSTTAQNLPSTGLLLVGMGPGSVGAMTLEAVEAATAAAHRRYEAYTALWPDKELNLLEQTIGSIQRVMRPEVEQPEELFALASTSLVALLVVGDPLQATTHVDLQLQAIEAGIECLVFHGISITTLVTGAIGLSNYRFGRQTTLTYPYGGWVATSPLETIILNRFTGLHTLALLDLDPTGLGTGDQRPMDPSDAVEAIVLMREKIEQGLSEREFSNDNPSDMMMKEALHSFVGEDVHKIRVVLCSDMGTGDQRIVSTTVDGLKDEAGGRLNCIVFPAATGEVEEKALLRWAKE
ncbi:MAG: diphthine synthase [Candidatus Poseidonia sp.]|uniref:diphthine synthase n=1 Tax=Poseidonia sp. TaxID=2666344 RepID=UPI0030BFE596|nr:diphthine synthase [Poseidonia sp.]MDG1552647.1 diphthine synthase [Poseidonia sp.]